MSKAQYHWGSVLLIAWWVVIVGGFGVIGNLYLRVLLLRHGETLPAIMFAIFGIGGVAYCYRTYRARAELRALAKR